jgi:hypothetical protein
MVMQYQAKGGMTTKNNNKLIKKITIALTPSDRHD